MEWLKYVNGTTIWPKIPVYLRTHYTEWTRNQRIQDAVRGASAGIAKLRDVNAANGLDGGPLPAHAPHPPASAPASPPAPMPASECEQPNSIVVDQHPTMPVSSMPPPLQPCVVGGMVIGGAQQPQSEKRKHGQRGLDKRARKRKSCQRCLSHGDSRAMDCAGRKWRNDRPSLNKCEFY